MEWTFEARERLASELRQRSRAQLEEWLLEIADLEGGIRGLLQWRSAALLGRFDTQALREMIQQLTEIPADVSWRASGPVERRIAWLPRLLQSALDCPSATGLPETIEFALWRAD